MIALWVIGFNGVVHVLPRTLTHDYEGISAIGWILGLGVPAFLLILLAASFPPDN